MSKHKAVVRKSQIETVLDHLLEKGSITSIEAIDDYKITRLSAVIHTLRERDGIEIDTEIVKQKALGVCGREYSQYGRYSLAPAKTTAPTAGATA